MKNSKTHNKKLYSLIYSAFIAGLCSIIYELLIATTASYFLGDSVKYFSLTIGIYMASMGLGSFVSKYVDEKNLLERFIIAELMLGFFGGISIPILYFAYAYLNNFIFFYIALTVIVGFLIGLEIPFLTRLMQDYNKLKFNIANILSFDYLGALIATISFPFILLPFFGVYQSSLIFGLVNMSIGFTILMVFSKNIGVKAYSYKALAFILTSILLAMIIFSSAMLRYWDDKLYQDRVIYSKQSKYQKIIVTKNKDDIRLFLDGNLQFSSIDEYRYHEALIHVPISAYPSNIKRVLLLGAGDGLAVKQLLKYDSIEEIYLVDLDNEITKLAKNNEYLINLNENSLFSKKVKIINQDAFKFLKDNHKLFDFIICDLPDPNNDILARLYSKQFYKLLKTNLSEKGLFVTQSTSPYFARRAFWSIFKTIETSNFKNTLPYHVEVPSFGDWGFIMSSNANLNIQNPEINIETKFLSNENYSKLFIFDKDISKINVDVNNIDRPILLKYYLEGWKNYR